MSVCLCVCVRVCVPSPVSTTRFGLSLSLIVNWRQGPTVTRLVWSGGPERTTSLEHLVRRWTNPIRTSLSLLGLQDSLPTPKDYYDFFDHLFNKFLRDDTGRSPGNEYGPETDPTRRGGRAVSIERRD